MNAEAQVLETDVILFPPPSERENSAPEEKIPNIEEKKKDLKRDIKLRFARLKKSVRKRSHGIF